MFSSVFLFLNVGTPELILILFVALLLFGGNKLPELARGLGKGMRDFKDASEGVKREIHNQINNFDTEKPSEPAHRSSGIDLEKHDTDVTGPVTTEPHETVKKEY
jgi:sec-independent protein translocase protein TatA